ncbi:MAG: TIGR03986 family CRISPR-associated RAMP protein [Pseudomonadota bacterium]
MPTSEHCEPSPARTASAPYNFVPLPDQVVPAVQTPDDLPDHDRLDPERHSGYFDVVLETLSPLYVRAPESVETFRLGTEDYDDFRDNPKHRADFFYTRTSSQPVIPGSSLRGMLRNVLAIATRSKLSHVDPSTRFFFRDFTTDPLKDYYNRYLGRLAKDVRAGYVVRTGSEWKIRPAKTPKACGIPTKDPVFKVKDKRFPDFGLPESLRFTSAAFQPGHHPVSFSVHTVSKTTDKGEKRVLEVKALSLKGGKKHSIQGILVSSGNMVETSDDASQSTRTRHVLLMEADDEADLLSIEEQAIEDYQAALTPFVAEHYGEQGVLKEGHPIFFVQPLKPSDPVVYFGHTLNFRIPARRTIDGVERAVTPRDLVPADLRDPAVVDFAEALFGFVRDDDASLPGKEVSSLQQGTKRRAYAGRVTVGDAQLEPGQQDVFMSTFTPSILGSPKPTTFQHYLEQPRESLDRLIHYGDRRARVRGFKRYWPQGPRSRADLEESDPQKLEDGAVPAKSTQHTQLKPVNPHKRFAFRIHFENLSEAELGALCWTLHPDSDEPLVHMLGMGKPLGMGAVRLAYTLTCLDLERRYTGLFDTNEARTPSTSERLALIEAFEEACVPGGRLSSDARIQALLAMMRWPGHPSDQSGLRFLLDQNRPNTRYMQIDRNGDDEYDGRPVLPGPLAFPKPPTSALTSLDPPFPVAPGWHLETIAPEDRVETVRSGPFEGTIHRMKHQSWGLEGQIKSPAHERNLRFSAKDYGADESWKDRKVGFYVEEREGKPYPVQIVLL